MCGITAIVDFNGNIGAYEIAQLNSTVLHRGPDNSGVYVDIHGQYAVALGHTRLSIIDPSPAGHQPMGLASAGRDSKIAAINPILGTAEMVVSYNGEIYNFKAIRKTLMDLGWSFESESDTEVLLKGFAEWGDQLPRMLVGMFAFALYDRARHRLTFCRDFPGIKPLYFYRTGQRMLFSSEVKSFAQFGLPEDEARVREFESSKYISQESMHADVQCLRPGTCLHLDLKERKTSQQTYSTLPSILDKKAYDRRAAKSESQLINDLDELLNRVVEDQMVADVPVGTICSGGIDSSLVTAMAATLEPSLKIFTLDVEDTSEIEYARIVAKHLRLELCEVSFNKNDFDRLAPTAAYFKDTPLVHPNSIAILKLSQAVKDDGVKVIMSGEGADEVFGGYQKYIDYKRVLWLRRVLPGLNKGLMPLIGDVNTLRFMVDNEVSPSDLWRIWPISHDREELQGTLRRLYREAGETAIDAELSSFVAKDIQYYLNPLLRRADRMTMAVGIEGRVPMLDQRIVEFGINLPVKYKVRLMQGGKFLLKKVAERYLPKSIVWRKKKGLPIPVVAWTGLHSKIEQKAFFLDLWRRANIQQTTAIEMSDRKSGGENAA